MTDVIRPALSAEEWKKREIDVSPNVAMYEDRDGWLSLSAFGYGEDVEARHAVAALALKDQPFGFAWEDVEALRNAADSAMEHAREHYGYPEHEAPYDVAEEVGALESLAARIAALLPSKSS